MISKHLAALAVSFAVVALTANADSPPPSQGGGHQTLKQIIDPHVAKAMKDGPIVGLTVAVTRKNKLLLGYGYGASRQNGSQITPMNAWMRTPSGSSGKAVMSGPMAWELLVEKGFNPETTKLYGANGLFQGKYDQDWKWARARFDRIAAMAISRNDVVYTWMRDGKVHKGWSRDLTSRNEAKSYSTPNGVSV